MFLAILAAAHLLAAEALDYDMSTQERKQTGVYKLTSKEKMALQRWIDAHYEKRDESTTQNITDKHATLSENLQNGRYIRLSDGSLWEVNPQDIPIAQGWITPVEIIVTQSGKGDYPYKLTNTLTGSSLSAKKPQAAKPTTPAPSKNSK